MSSNHLGRAALLILVPAILGLACGDSTEPEPENQQPPTSTLTGSWTFEVTITNETGDCAGNNEPPWEATVQITQTGNQVTATSDWNSDPGTGPHEFGGTLTDDNLVLDGSYPEGAGTTLALYQLSVAADRNSMNGTETWSWFGEDALCHDSGSTVQATRIPPD